MEIKRIGGKPLAWLLTAVYFASYVTRINFAAIIQEIVTDMGYEKAALSIVLVVISITYGAGQIINGKLGDKIRPDLMILMGLIISTAANLLFPLFISSIPVMAVLWGVNGFAQAMMWPPMVKILVTATDTETYNYAVVRVSWGSSIGTIFVYLSAPLIISLVGWRAVFYTSAAVGVAMAIVWQMLRGRISADTSVKEAEVTTPERFRFPKEAICPILFIAAAIIFQGMLRDGISSWMPTYLSEVFHLDNETSILLTVSLAIFSIITSAIAGAAYKKYFKNEVMLGGVIFAISAIASLLLYLLFDFGIAVTVVLMMIVNGCMHGINLMLITHVPKRFKKYGNISTISGLINSCTYIGAAISTYGIALLSESVGWRGTIGVWLVIAVLGTACCFVSAVPWKKFYKEK